MDDKIKKSLEESGYKKTRGAPLALIKKPEGCSLDLNNLRVLLSDIDNNTEDVYVMLEHVDDPENPRYFANLYTKK